MNRAPVRILITGGHRSAGLWITRHLGAAGNRVIASDSRSLPFGLKSRYASSFELLPETYDAAYADQLLALIRRTRPEVLIPFGSVAAVSARRNEFERETAVLAPDADALGSLADKAVVYALCRQLDIPHPRVFGTDPETVIRQLPPSANGLPLAVVKPRRDFGAGRGLAFIHRHEGLAEVWRGLAKRYGALVATEFVPGPVHAQNALHLLFDRDSELIEFFVLQKLRQWPGQSGITAAAISTHELELVEQMLPLFRQLRWRGPVEVELKRHPGTGAACVLEINPRFSGTVAFSLAAGVDLPGAMASASLGDSRPRMLQPYYPAGLYYCNPWPYVRSVASDLCRPGRIGQGLRALAMPLTRRTVGNPYSIRDPGPLVGKTLVQMAEALQRRQAGPEREAPQ